ncbi:DUF1592 domain-containing protein [Pseudenhygromyxa sp. WMMC2535]|uniref:DUF1592 domain-containing protein n=1 Tax=Pseudenhygromyxa sp. WMMC2535 TaxID=2712867 RepID=UPI001551B921|nr:DUF1592 domain-containing protein [Pseudenhygromyxa sp. WMMC2535]NVB42580.1 DUF1592 domain-containing protein [Pseudenhygromyxa sp. WMMC2535]
MAKRPVDRSLLPALCLPFALAACYSGSGPGGDDEASDDAATADGGSEGSEGNDTGESEDLLDPGRVTMHRLNNAEYNNTVRDLFFGMLDVSPADEFPADEHSYGFDNISDVQSLSPLHFELYARTAENLVDEALRIVADAELHAWEAEADAEASVGGASGGFWNLWSNGEVFSTFEAAGDGTFVFETRAYASQSGDDLAHMQMTIDSQVVYESDIAATESELAEVHQVEVQLDAGVHKLAVVFTNDALDADLNTDRNLYVDYLQIEGPNDPIPNPLRDMILTCDPGVDGEDPCLRQVIDEFVTRAWRRPLTTAEVDDLMGLYATVETEGGEFEDALRLVLSAALTSPHFIFRVELDPTPEDLEPHPLSDYELASRLSYFLWSSMPDDELFALAREGKLQDQQVLEQQVDRMLADSKSEALVENFAGQWLYIRALDDLFKDTVTFPEFTDEVRASMRAEMQSFFRAFIVEERPMTELLTGTQTMIDDNLAPLYGLDPVGAEPVAVDISALPRAGFLTTPGLMAVLSHPITTSPVKRGKWVLDQLLCVPPPPPPADIDIPQPDPEATGTMREQLDAHRSDPVCASCHSLIDPIGLAFENYDPIGRYRLLDKGLEIDPSGEMPTDGDAFADALGMAELMADDPEFPRCTMKKTMTYALGRGLTLDDIPYLDEIEAEFATTMRFPDLVKLIVTSELFTARRGEQEGN